MVVLCCLFSYVDHGLVLDSQLRSAGGTRLEIRVVMGVGVCVVYELGGRWWQLVVGFYLFIIYDFM